MPAQHTQFMSNGSPLSERLDGFVPAFIGMHVSTGHGLDYFVDDIQLRLHNGGPEATLYVYLVSSNSPAAEKYA